MLLLRAVYIIMMEVTILYNSTDIAGSLSTKCNDTTVSDRALSKGCMRVLSNLIFGVYEL